MGAVLAGTWLFFLSLSPVKAAPDFKDIQYLFGLFCGEEAVTQLFVLNLFA